MPRLGFVIVSTGAVISLGRVGRRASRGAETACRKEIGMRKRCLGMLAIGVLLVSVLAGCTTTAASREDLGGLPRAEYPEYMAHPLRVIALAFHSTGNVLQYSLAEPFYFLISPVPEFVGLSLEERRYLDERKEAWRGYFAGERPAVQ